MRNLFLCLFFVPLILFGENYVYYERSGGRFGDQLTDYLNGRWVNYKTGAKLVYDPIEYGKELVLSRRQNKLKLKDYYSSNTIYCYTLDDIKPCDDKDVVYKIPHFTDFSMDVVVNVKVNKGFFLKTHLVDWRDKNFYDIIVDEVAPLKRINIFSPTNGSHSIALHYRDGGSIDIPLYRFYSPLRFQPKPFYEKALFDLISTIPDCNPIFVGVFTDADDPWKVAAEFESYLHKQFPERSVHVVLSPASRGNEGGVLEDFFSIGQFQYVISTESLFSYLAVRLGAPVLTLKPQLFGEDWAGYYTSKTVALDLKYKKFDDHKILAFDPSSGDLETDLVDILNRLWFCYKNDLFFDLTFSHPLYGSLKRALLKPLPRASSFEFPAESGQSIDWSDSIFLALAREIFSPRSVFPIPINQNSPSIAFYDPMGDLNSYYQFLERSDWDQHQLTIYLPHELTKKEKGQRKIALKDILRKKGYPDVSIHFVDMSKDPLEFFVSVGLHDVVITKPQFLIETAARVFGSKSLIVLGEQ